jgi:hypothetical protein
MSEPLLELLAKYIYLFETNNITMIYSNILISILLAMSLSLSAASAAIDNATVQYYVDDHNSRIDNVPEILKNFIGNVRIDVNITNNDGSVYRTGLVMKDARVSRIVEGGIDDPTVSINATEDAIFKIIRSNNIMAAFQQEMNIGSISIRMHHPQTDGNRGSFAGLPSFFGQSSKYKLSPKKDA